MKQITSIFRQYLKIKKMPADDYSETEKAIVLFVTGIHNFFKMHDLYTNTNHAQLFEMLFLSKRKLSGEYIARKAFISVKTLYRFKKKCLSFMSDALKSGVWSYEKGQIMSVFQSLNVVDCK